MHRCDKVIGENKVVHNLKCPFIPYHLCRILNVGGSGIGKKWIAEPHQMREKRYYHIMRNINMLIKMSCEKQNQKLQY